MEDPILNELPADIPPDSRWLAERNIVIRDAWLENPTGGTRRRLEENATAVRNNARSHIHHHVFASPKAKERMRQNVDGLDGDTESLDAADRSVRSLYRSNRFDRLRGARTTT